MFKQGLQFASVRFEGNLSERLQPLRRQHRVGAFGPHNNEDGERIAFPQLRKKFKAVGSAQVSQYDGIAKL